jgi:hypothetical protein
VQLYRCFGSQSSEFCLHNLLCCFSMSNTIGKRIFSYRFSPETFGYTLVWLNWAMTTSFQSLPSHRSRLSFNFIRSYITSTLGIVSLNNRRISQSIIKVGVPSELLCNSLKDHRLVTHFSNEIIKVADTNMSLYRYMILLIK